MHPVITIFCAFTRRWAVDKWLEDLNNIVHDPKQTNLCFIVDADEPYIATATKKFAEKHHYRSYHIAVNDDHEPNEVRIARRRERIALVKNQSKDLINQTDGEIVVCFEDDTVMRDPETIFKLITPLSDQVGFVEGVQAGRWGVKMIGAWRVHYAPQSELYAAQALAVPTSAETCLPDAMGGHDNISAGGFYGYATWRKLYLNHDYYQSTGEPWGPDVNYGLWLGQRGWDCLVDWDLTFGHRDHEAVIWPVAPLSKIVYNRDITTGRWTRNDYDKKG
jgi:hypothetical protein